MHGLMGYPIEDKPRKRKCEFTEEEFKRGYTAEPLDNKPERLMVVMRRMRNADAR